MGAAALPTPLRLIINIPLGCEAKQAMVPNPVKGLVTFVTSKNRLSLFIFIPSGSISTNFGYSEKDQDVTRSEILQPIFELAYGNDYKNKTQREKTFNKIMNQLRLQAIE